MSSWADRLAGGVILSEIMLGEHKLYLRHDEPFLSIHILFFYVQSRTKRGVILQLYLSISCVAFLLL